MKRINMETQQIRRHFLKYFKDNGHSVINSSPVIPHDDPTLLFINAGMNQFKDVFLGSTIRDYTRATTTQKCIRVGGKHNDLENVGHTARHLTFFEMLGNFSFGDYFKKEAIRFAWEVSTQVFGFDAERIWPSVFREDDEAFELWKEFVPEKRITRFDEKDNFWEMGNTGPCGPCSELYYDRGAHLSDASNPFEDPDGHRFLEFWNLVFMEYNRVENGALNPLPKPSVDTGAGLERVVSIKMGVDSVYETDILRGLIAQTENLVGVKYDLTNHDTFPAFQVIADHLRCLAFAIADGVQPSNVDRGYVLRKVLRRAVRYGRGIGFEKPFLAKILPRLIETMGDDFPELRKSQSLIEEILTVEEESFLRTLRRGGNILNQIITHAQEHGKIITGDDAFKLKDTYGLPFEEVVLLAKDGDLSVDTKRYHELEGEAKERSRKAHKETKQVAAENLFADYAKEKGSCSFIGYQETEGKGQVTAIVVNGEFVDSINEGQQGMIVMNKTPFYAEMGGQVGDTGILSSDSSQFAVTDCQAPFKGVISHIGDLKSGTINLGDNLNESVDPERRQKIGNNHTATHLLHWALQKVLGEHIKQAGSVVDPYRLRFDFSHHKAMTPEELREIEDLVNSKIRGNLIVDSYELTYDDVQKRDDIKQFFGDKYDAKVRVIDIDYSKELCGGTHTSHVGNIGLFRIAKESSIAAGVRRIEAVTGEDAEALSRESDNQIHEIADMLKIAPQKLMSRLEKVLQENKDLQKQLKEAKQQQAEGMVTELLNNIEIIGEIPLLTVEVNIPPKDLRPFADTLHNKMGKGILVVGAAAGEDKCNLIVMVSDDVISQGFKAVDIIRGIAPIVNGGGGGKADTAQAGGKAPDKLGEALAKAKELLTK
jgi:alanyl-tRNA synthetase